jgi:hypothetical protein
VEAQEAEQVAEQARLDSEQEAIRLRMNDAAEAIARVRDTSGRHRTAAVAGVDSCGG